MSIKLLLRKSKKTKLSRDSQKFFFRQEMKAFFTRFYLLIFAIFFALAVAESLAVIGYWIQDQKIVSLGEKLKSEQGFFLDNQNAFQAARGKLKINSPPRFPHPYLGHTLHAIPPDALPVNSSGFHGSEFPLFRTPGVFQLMVSGGSVAEQLGMHGSLKKLEDELNRNYTNGKIKKFVIYNGAMAAWHQPQQLIMLMLWAQAMDGFVTVEGWNESRALARLDKRMRLEMPDELYYLAMATHFGRSFRFIGYQMDAAVKKWQRTTFLGKHSKLAFFLSQRLRNVFRNWAVKEVVPVPDVAKNFSQKQFTFPEGWTPEQMKNNIIDSYKKYMRLMHAVAEEEGVKDLFVIQPTPVYGKALTQDELKKAGDLKYRDLYLEMTAKLLQLRGQGVPVYDALDVFNDVKGALYVDAIHTKPEGSDILEARLLQLIVREWDLKKNNQVLER